MNQKHIDPVSGKTLRELAEETGLLYSTLFIRLTRKGWTGKRLVQRNHGLEKLFMGKTFRQWATELSDQYGTRVTPQDVRHFTWSAKHYGGLEDEKEIMNRFKKALSLQKK